MPGGGWGDAECLGNIGRGGDTPGEPDKVTHVMRRERGERERGESGHRMRGEAEEIRHQELRLAVTTRGMRRGERLSLMRQWRPSEARSGDKNSDQSSPDICDDLFVSPSLENMGRKVF